MADSDFATVRVVKDIVALCNAIFDQIYVNVQTLLGNAPIQIPTPAAGWINYGGGFAGLRYRKNAVGVVTIEGMIQAPGGTPTTGVIFTLEPGYRPADTLMFHCWCGGGAYRCDVAANGNVTINSGNTVFTSFAGISFYAV